MRVVFLEDVTGVANGGDIREVKNGFARNYLFPKSLAVPATHNALQGVKKLRGEADDTRLKTLSDMKALAKELDGVKITVDMRAGTGGRLYGSVTNTMIAEQLSTLTGREIDRHSVAISDAFRELGLFDVKLRLHPEVEAQISVLVYATGTDPEEILAALAESEAEEGDEDSPSPEGDSEVAVAEEGAVAENEEKDS
jgi:large subunit ribosomal protein L9